MRYYVISPLNWRDHYYSRLDVGLVAWQEPPKDSKTMDVVSGVDRVVIDITEKKPRYFYDLISRLRKILQPDVRIVVVVIGPDEHVIATCRSFPNVRIVRERVIDDISRAFDELRK